MKDQPDTSRKAAAPAGAGRRPYRKPQLAEYGSIAKLTQGTRTNQSDGPGGGFKRTCL